MTRRPIVRPEIRDPEFPYLEPLCPCGAAADRVGMCRKCRARIRWQRRTGHR
ncbi:hypothetical protein [Cryptosporangium sp. NPDC051539]|uniref:hypothetical protein n=1 Tax=Cryptosporangium sp. NPDC051539 TaxID=3363962 RepID=UPI0037BA905F